MSPLSRLLVLASTLAVCTGTSTAQSLAVRTLALRSGEMPKLFLRGGKDFLPLEFSAVQPNETVKAVAVNPLPIYKSIMDEEGNAKFVVAHKVKVPTGARGILLLGWASGEDTKFVAIKDNFSSAGFNDWLLINASTKPVAFQVGQKTRPIQLSPGASKNYRVSAEKGKGTAVIAQAPFDGKAKTFFSTYWPVYPDKRAVVLFIDDGKKIRVKRISDKLQAPAS